MVHDKTSRIFDMFQSTQSQLVGDHIVMTLISLKYPFITLVLFPSMVEESVKERYREVYQTC